MPHPEWPKTPNWEWLLSSEYVDRGILTANMGFDEIACEASGLLCYLATPYSREVVDAHGDWQQQYSEIIAEKTALWSGLFAAKGITVVSPILLSASMVHADTLAQLEPLDAAFWETWCAPLLFNSQRVIVPPVNGWRESLGIWREVEWSCKQSRKIYLSQAGFETKGQGL